MNSDYIYLNNAATSFPKPPPVIEAVKAQLDSIPCHHSRTGFERQERDVFSSSRELLAKLFNVDKPERIVFTSGATEAINLALKGLELAGGHIISSSIEHNSVLRPLKILERQGIIELTIVGCDNQGRINPADVKSALKNNTKVIILNHCSNVSGAVTDLEAIGKITASCDNLAFIVDASQSAGTIPIDVDRMNIDLLAFTGHKSLFGYPGSGGLYIRESLDLEPLKTGGTGIKSDYLYQPQTMPIYYEAGTQNNIGAASLEAGVAFVLDKGVENIHKHKQNCVQTMISALRKQANVILYANFHTDEIPSLFSFNIKGMDPADVGYILENSFKIITRSGLHCAPLIHKEIGSFPAGSVRVSPSGFTSDDEIDKFLTAVSQICKTV